MEYGSYKLPLNKRKILVFLIFIGFSFLLLVAVPKEGWGVRRTGIWIACALFFTVLLEYWRDYVYGEMYEWIKKNVNCPLCGGRMVRCEQKRSSRSGETYELQCGGCGREFELTPKFGHSGLVLQDKAPGASGINPALRVLISLMLIAIIVYFLFRDKL